MIFEIFATPKNIPFCTFSLRKDPKYIELTTKTSQFCDDPKNIHKIFIPPKKFHFSDPPPPPPPTQKKKNILKIKILNTKKWSEPTYV